MLVAALRNITPQTQKLPLCLVYPHGTGNIYQNAQAKKTNRLFYMGQQLLTTTHYCKWQEKLEAYYGFDTRHSSSLFVPIRPSSILTIVMTFTDLPGRPFGLQRFPFLQPGAVVICRVEPLFCVPAHRRASCESLTVSSNGKSSDDSQK